MKNLLLTLSVLFSINAVAQNDNPFASIGKVGEVQTLSNGRYEEVFKNEKLRRVGSVMMDTETMKIDHFLTEEELKECQNLETEKQASRFLSVDPLANKFPFYTPYQFAGNKPIVAIDLDGLEDLWVHYIQQEDGTLLLNKTAYQLTEEQNRMYSETWGVNIPKTGVVYTVASTQTRQTQIVYTGVTAVVTAKGTPKEEKKAEIRHVGFEHALRGNTMHEMEGEEGLNDFSTGLTVVGTGLKVTPLAPVGQGMTIFSDIIDTGLDFKNKDTKTAVTNMGIRLATLGFGKIVDKGIDNVTRNLPRSLGNETNYEKAVQLGIDAGLEKGENELTK